MGDIVNNLNNSDEEIEFYTSEDYDESQIMPMDAWYNETLVCYGTMNSTDTDHSNDTDCVTYRNSTDTNRSNTACSNNTTNNNSCKTLEDSTNSTYTVSDITTFCNTYTTYGVTNS